MYLHELMKSKNNSPVRTPSIYKSLENRDSKFWSCVSICSTPLSETIKCRNGWLFHVLEFIGSLWLNWLICQHDWRLLLCRVWAFYLFFDVENEVDYAFRSQMLTEGWFYGFANYEFKFWFSFYLGESLKFRIFRMWFIEKIINFKIRTYYHHIAYF